MHVVRPHSRQIMASRTGVLGYSGRSRLCLRHCWNAAARRRDCRALLSDGRGSDATAWTPRGRRVTSEPGCRAVSGSMRATACIRSVNYLWSKAAFWRIVTSQPKPSDALNCTSEESGRPGSNRHDQLGRLFDPDGSELRWWIAAGQKGVRSGAEPSERTRPRDIRGMAAGFPTGSNPADCFDPTFLMVALHRDLLGSANAEPSPGGGGGCSADSGGVGGPFASCKESPRGALPCGTCGHLRGCPCLGCLSGATRPARVGHPRVRLRGCSIDYALAATER